MCKYFYADKIKSNKGLFNLVGNTLLNVTSRSWSKRRSDQKGNRGIILILTSL